MGGYFMWFLVRATNREEAMDAAEDAINGLFEDGSLVVGDKGYVNAKEDPEDGEVLSAKENPPAFVEVLRSLTTERLLQARALLLQALDYATRAGVSRLEDLQPEEVAGRDAGMAGHMLWHAGAVLARYWTPRGLLYDADDYQMGVDEDRIREIEANPDGWWLVEVTVG